MSTQFGKIEVKKRVKSHQTKVLGVVRQNGYKKPKWLQNTKCRTRIEGAVVGGKRGLIQIRKCGREKLTPFLLIVR